MALKRAHLYAPLTDEAGELLRYAQVRVYNTDGTLYTGKLYRDGKSTQTYSNPHVVSPGLVSLYLDKPARVILGVAADQSKPEVLTNPRDVRPDASQMVSSVSPLYITGTPTLASLLCATDASDAFWHPLKIDHEHAMVAPNTMLTGRNSALQAQAGDFTGSTVLGANSGGSGARSTLRYITAYGFNAQARGRGCVALGVSSYATEASEAPWHGGALAVGNGAAASCEGTAIGTAADASVTTGSGAGLLGQQLSVGLDASGSGPLSVSLGALSTASQAGIAIGMNTGTDSNGAPGSIGLGAGAQYGLPSDASSPTVLLGASDPSALRTFPWANPLGSQSESPWDEYTPTMTFTGKTVQLQRHLRWVVNAVAMRVAGDATLGGPGGTLGFYGHAPVVKGGVGDDEPSSGIPALDSLIYALRDLGLLNARTEALATYRAEDLTRAFRDGDLVPSWGEHAGTDVAVYQRPGVPAKLRGEDDDFNDYPAVIFANSVYRRAARPLQEYRAPTLLPRARHVIAVAGHPEDEFGNQEGLVNLSESGHPINSDDAVLMARGRTTWQDDNLSKYEIDGLNQPNRDARLPQEPHVYRVTHRSTWPHGRPILGGPRDQDTSRAWDNYSGEIAEVVALDATWDETHAHSMATGLMFKYGIDQDDDALQEPAEDFIVTQHDPAGGVWVFFDDDYPDSYRGRVYGKVYNCPKPVNFIPFLSIFIYFDVFSFRGALLGNWGNLDIFIDYEVEVSIWAGDLDGDGDIDTRVDVDVEFDEEVETRIGSFSLNSNFSWSMGQRYSNYGHKVCRIRHRQTREVFCISGCPSFRYWDTEVRVYSVQPDGSLTYEGTSPLWGDGTFGVRCRHAGHKIARVYEKSTGNLLGTTEWHEKALPRTTVYATDDSDYSVAAVDRAYTYQSALAALSFLEMSRSRLYRARNILRTLAGVRNGDGSLNQYYSAALPVAGLGTVSPRGMAWTVLAMLRYQQQTGDSQFLAAAQAIAGALINLQGTSGVRNGSVLSAAGSTTARTEDSAVAYFALRDLGVVTGTASYTNAANAVKANLLANHWLPALNRFGQGAGDDAEALAADVWGGLFLLAIGDRVKAQATIRHLKRYRVKNAQVTASHYAGPGSLIGYKPYAELGTSPYVNPPGVIEQPLSWAAILFKMRYGEPAGDDITSLMRWRYTSILNDPSRRLYGEQFLAYNATVTTSPYSLRARPDLASASWGYLLSRGARYLLAADALATPTPANVNLTCSFDRNAYRFVFRFTWTADSSAQIAAFEGSPESSINAGQSWSAVSGVLVAGQAETVRDATVASNGFSASWSIPVPANLATQYRVRVRLRNATFGGWITSNAVPLPPIT